MPWIRKQDRTQFESSLQTLVPKLTTKESGNLTYVLYEIVTRVWSRERRWTHACILLGALFGALMCFFMKHVWKYELEKCNENDPTDGDIEADSKG